MVAAFGGVNVLMFGDFWQLPAPGHTAIMHDPRTVPDNIHANFTLNLFWGHANETDRLQTWSENTGRILHLAVNQRSGADTWFSHILQACRLGALSDMDYNYLHGFPTSKCGSHVDGNNAQTVHCTCEQCRDIECGNFEKELECEVQTWFDQHSLRDWDAHKFWSETAPRHECHFCRQERKRRQRVMLENCSFGMSPEDANTYLTRNPESILITEFNRPVCLYALLRVQDFAQSHGQQVLWIQARDTPPAMHFGEYSQAELQALKRKWVEPTYHARKTEGILSLLPCTYDLPCRVTNGNGKQCREYKVHNGTRCRVKAWSLTAADEQMLRSCTDAEVMLADMPLTLYVELQGEDRKQYPGLPHNWFPLTPTTSYWALDQTENIHIARRGFPLVPDFSSTIHCATGIYLL